jgi:radical SAM protein with 4Fe4S-binding SPASM domain
MLTGGEPFMRRDILEIISLLVEKKIRISYIFSNGLLLTQEKLISIRQLGIAPVFQVSFDGVGAHDYMRGTVGTEAAVIKSIRLLRSCGFHVVVSTSIDTVTVNTLQDTYECMKELGVGFWRITSPQESGNWKGTLTKLSLEDEDRYLRPILDCWLQDEKPFGIQLGGFYRSDIPSNETDKRPKYTLDSFDCGTCKTNSYLLPNGTLLPCAGYVGTNVEAKMPNLFEMGLKEIWSSSYLQEISDLKKRDVIAYNQECVDCEMFEDCGMGCRVSALVETGDIMAKDQYSCKLWKDGFKQQYDLEISNNQKDRGIRSVG